MTANIPFDELWQCFRRGDHRAFEAIYRQYAPILIDYGTRISGNSEAVEDGLQDLFIELWTSRERLSPTTSIKAYLFKALRYKLMRMGNTPYEQLRQPIDEVIYKIRSSSCEDILIEMEVQSAQMQQLRETLKALPERQREAIMLRYYHNFSNEEMAGIMNITYNAACKHVYAAIRTLKENLKPIAVSVFLILTKYFFSF